MEKVLPIYDGETVSVYHWAPPAQHNYKNFGDEIGPMMAERLLHESGFDDVKVVGANKGRNKILAVGSVIQQAVDGDFLWGSGVNGKSWPRNLEKIKSLKVSLVRGPLTRDVLTFYGHSCPELYGDPGLIFPALFEAEILKVSQTMSEEEFGEVIYIPNLNDDRFLDQTFARSLSGIKYISPKLSPFKMAAIVKRAKLVISSSLHGIVFSDAYGTPVIPMLSYFEPIFKYIDYFEGTGRTDIKFANNLLEALDSPELPKAQYDHSTIRDTFPVECLGVSK